MYQKQLQNLGLSDKEAKTYEILINLGPAKASRITAETKFKKGDTYNILRALKEKNLITEKSNNKKTIFQANAPIELNKLIREKEKELESQKNEIDQLIPTLTSIFQNTNDKPIVQIHNGINGVKLFYKDLLKEKKDFLIFVSRFHRQNEELETLVEEQITKQQKVGLKLRALNPIQKLKFSLTPTEYIENQKKLGAEVRFIPNEFSFDSQIFVYGNKICIISLKNELVTTMIENENISNTLKTLFEYIWQTTKNFHESILENNHY